MSARVTVVIQVPAGGFIKRRTDGSVDFVSPLPCPFNYGEVSHIISEDGDPLDAVVLGPRLSHGSAVEVEVFGGVVFIDAGQRDPKLICGVVRPGAIKWRMIRAWFACYALAKGALNRVRGKSGATRLGADLDVDVIAELLAFSS